MVEHGILAAPMQFHVEAVRWGRPPSLLYELQSCGIRTEKSFSLGNIYAYHRCPLRNRTEAALVLSAESSFPT
jgi:hypothetical protein